MKDLVGRVLFWLIWPGLWLVFPLTRRVRVVIIKDQKVLMVKHWIGPGTWSIPGGGVKFGEKLKDAAIREIQEELGVTCVNVDPIHEGVVVHRQYGLLFRLQYVRAKIESGSPMQENREISDISWQPLTALEGNMPKSVVQAVIGLK